MIEFLEGKQAFIMMVGIPASGKSYYAKQLKECERKDIVIHSSDDLREELFGDVNSQSDNDLLFKTLHKRIKDDLRASKSVIYDATNISKKRRKAFLSEIRKFHCKTVCILALSPYEYCLKRNKERDRSIPDEVITRMYKNFQPPSLDEGFDNIILIYDNLDNKLSYYTIGNFFHGAVNACEIDQENKHHTRTIGNHCIAVYEHLKKKYPADIVLQVAGLLHDIGKPFTKTRLKRDGGSDGDCHYYNHQNVGAYDSFFYSFNLGTDLTQAVDIANIIYYHMLPLTWRGNENIEKKHKKQMGMKMYQYVKKLNEADIKEG